jgi:hypothetical protein
VILTIQELTSDDTGGSIASTTSSGRGVAGVRTIGLWATMGLGDVATVSLGLPGLTERWPRI